MTALTVWLIALFSVGVCHVINIGVHIWLLAFGRLVQADKLIASYHTLISIVTTAVISGVLYTALTEGT